MNKLQKSFKPGRGYTKEDWDAVSDNPRISKAEAAKMKPFREALPELANAMEREIALRGSRLRKSPSSLSPSG